MNLEVLDGTSNIVYRWDLPLSFYKKRINIGTWPPWFFIKRLLFRFQRFYQFINSDRRHAGDLYGAPAPQLRGELEDRLVVRRLHEVHEVVGAQDSPLLQDPRRPYP